MAPATGICPVGDHPFTYEVRGTPTIYCSPAHRHKANAERQKAKNTAQSERRCAYGNHTVPAAKFSSPSAPYCREHMAAFARDRRAELGGQDPEHARMISLRRHGLTPEEFARRLAAQGGRCKICRTGDPGASGWHVDHDHACCNTRKRSCGKCFRGILCSHCNIGLGNLRDDPVIIAAALEYVTTRGAVRLAAGTARLAPQGTG
jgi:hypothetical protein